MNLFEFIKTSKENNGASYNLHTGELNPKSGYMVAQKGSELIVPELTKEVVKGFILDHIDILQEDKDLFIGTWKNGNKWYIDISRLVDNYADAYVLADKNEQIAIYCLDTFQEINMQQAKEALQSFDSDMDIHPLAKAILKRSKLANIKGAITALPSPQTSGTSYQNYSYALLKAKQLLGI